MSLITIPVYVHMVTCESGTTSHPHDWNPNQVNAAFTIVNRIWNQAEIRFQLRPPAEVTISFPASAAVALLDDAALLQVARQLRHRAGPGITLACVAEFARGTRAAVAMADLNFCAVERTGGRSEPTALALAHELGHCLGLHHPERPPDGPRQQDAVLAYGRNLMQEGVVRPNPELTPEQRRDARASRVAQRFPPAAG